MFKWIQVGLELVNHQLTVSMDGDGDFRFMTSFSSSDLDILRKLLSCLYVYCKRNAQNIETLSLWQINSFLLRPFSQIIPISTIRSWRSMWLKSLHERCNLCSRLITGICMFLSCGIYWHTMRDDLG